jgi:hypothetical protein
MVLHDVQLKSLQRVCTTVPTEVADFFRWLFIVEDGQLNITRVAKALVDRLRAQPPRLKVDWCAFALFPAGERSTSAI